MITIIWKSSIEMVRFERSFEETALKPPSPILLMFEQKLSNLNYPIYFKLDSLQKLIINRYVGNIGF